MGIDYEHYIIPEDPDLEFSENQIAAIIQVLESHDIWRHDAGTVFVSNDGKESQERTSNGWIWHDGVDGVAVGKLFGESVYGGKPEDMYLGGVAIVFGDAKKIHFSGSEEIEIWTTNTDLIEVDLPFSQPFYEMTYDDIDETDMNINVNNTEIKNYTWFKGWWKSAIIIDFHKSVPAWGSSAKMPNSDLLIDLKSATGIEFREIGSHS